MKGEAQRRDRGKETGKRAGEKEPQRERLKTKDRVKGEK
jgi:hypothetical protein